MALCTDVTKQKYECLAQRGESFTIFFGGVVFDPQIRNELEQHMSCNLKEYKEFIDNEMLLILGQMDKATLIFDHVYLVRILLCTFFFYYYYYSFLYIVYSVFIV